jgi:hypothetical protein
LVGETNDSYLQPVEDVCSFVACLYLSFILVIFAIYFDSETNLRAIEIDNKIIQRMLPSEFKAFQVSGSQNFHSNASAAVAACFLVRIGTELATRFCVGFCLACDNHAMTVHCKSCFQEENLDRLGSEEADASRRHAVFP